MFLVQLRIQLIRHSCSCMNDQNDIVMPIISVHASSKVQATQASSEEITKDEFGTMTAIPLVELVLQNNLQSNKECDTNVLLM